MIFMSNIGKMSCKVGVFDTSKCYLKKLEFWYQRKHLVPLWVLGNGFLLLNLFSTRIWIEMTKMT